MGEKGEGFTGTIKKDTWTIMGRGGVVKREGNWGGLGWYGRVGGKGRKLLAE